MKAVLAIVGAVLLAALQAFGAPLLVPSLGGIVNNVTYINGSSGNTSGSAIANGALLTNLVKNAPVPGLVIINSGFYMTPTNTLPSVMARSNMKQFWYPGARWANGTSGGDPSMMYDDYLAASRITNFQVAGYGEFIYTNIGGSGDIFHMETIGSSWDLEYQLAEAYGGSGGSVSIGQLAGGQSMQRHRVGSYILTDTYDTFYAGGNFALGNSNKFFLDCPLIITGQDLWEFYDFSNWGDAIVNFGFAMRTNSLNFPTIMQCGGRMLIKGQRIFSGGGGSVASAAGSKTNAVIEGCWIESESTNMVSTVGTSGNGYGTDLLFRNCRFTGPAGVDPITVSNLASRLTLENCTIDVGASATNAIRSKSGVQTVIINGPLSLNNKVVYPDTNLTVLASKRIVLASSVTPVASAGAAVFTNLQSYIVTASQLANNGDALEFTASGTWNNALGGTTQFLWTNTILGTVFDTGAQTISNGTWTTKLRITRMGAALQLNDVSVSTASVGSAWQGTNKSPLTAQTLSSATVIRLVSQTPNNGQLTNNNWLVEYIPAQ